MSKTVFYQTKPTQPKIYPNHQEWGFLATWCLNKLKFSKLVAYIKSSKQKHFAPNQTKPKRRDMRHGTWDMVAIVVLSPNQSKFSETVAYITSY